jgi:hypothetical protein
MVRFCKIASAFVLAVVVLSSCATVSQKGRPYYDFQAMGEENVIVVTIDARKEQELVQAAFSDLEEFARRSRRVSLALKPTSDAYPLEADAISAYGVVEGDYPKFLINTGMMYAKELERKGNSDGLTWFSQKSGPVSLYTPKNDKLLFTNGSYEESYSSFAAKNRLIDDQTAMQMAQSSIAVYSLHPETFFDLGLVAVTVIKQAKSMLLLINADDAGSYTLDAYITMDTAKLASTLSQMVRTAYIARLKREKIPYKIADLMKMFLIEDDRVTIKHMELGEEQMEALRHSLTGML